MNQAGNVGRSTRPRGASAGFVLALGVTMMGFAAGCQGQQMAYDQQGYDPLVTSSAIPPLPGAGRPAVAGGPRGGVPPIPDRMGRTPAELTTVGRGVEDGGPPDAGGTGQTSLLAAGAPPDPYRAAAGDTYGQLHEQLRERGVTWWRLERVGDTDEYKFECSVPHRDNPNIRRVYEAQARGGFGTEAIRAVLQQIDRERRPADR